MRILFLDQSGELGGAELCLVDMVRPYRDRCLIGLFTDGPFKAVLEQQQIPVQILATEALQVRKQSSVWQGLASLRPLLSLVRKVARLSREFDLIYANTQKALVVGALASGLSRRPLIYHLHDIISAQHFSAANRRLVVALANQFAAQVFATSAASRAAFIQAGGNPDRVTVVYNGFEPTKYQANQAEAAALRHTLRLNDRFVVGHFSRLSPWKGQHVLIQALSHCPDNVVAMVVGDALYGEHEYVQQLHQQVADLGLHDRVRFLGFRSDVVPLMQACDLIAHTSIAPEPFGRVIVEAMLCQRPVVAAAAGGAVELIETGTTGWLTSPGDVPQLAAAIRHCQEQPAQSRTIAQQAQQQASQRFQLSAIHKQVADILETLRPSLSATIAPSPMRRQAQ